MQTWTPAGSAQPLTTRSAPGPVPLQRIFSAPDQPASTPLTAFAGADTSTGPVRRLLAGPPVVASPLATSAVSGPAAGAHGIQTTETSTALPVQRASASRPGPAGGDSTPGGDHPAGGFTELVIQRQSEDDAPVPESPAPPTGGTTESATAAPQAPSAPMVLPSGRDLDELAERLYEPLSARLRAELWLDRERSGLMVDLRR